MPQASENPRLKNTLVALGTLLVIAILVAVYLLTHRPPPVGHTELPPDEVLLRTSSDTTSSPEEIKNFLDAVDTASKPQKQ